MKPIPFVKMEGAGNDFIVIEGVPLNLTRFTRQACDRTRGIGADGLLVLTKSRKADYRMRIINADGSEAEMCGNGARCLAAYIARYKSPKKKLMSLETKAGIIAAKVDTGSVSVKLSEPAGYRFDVPLTILGKTITVHCLDTGVPHAVVFVDGLRALAIEAIGRAIRRHRHFAPRGTNVDFVEQIDARTILVRTYERGVEGETRACGTGSVAAAILTYLKAHPGIRSIPYARMDVRTACRETLSISFSLRERAALNVWLTGPTRLIAKGEYYV